MIQRIMNRGNTFNKSNGGFNKKDAPPPQYLRLPEPVYSEPEFREIKAPEVKVPVIIQPPEDLLASTGSGKKKNIDPALRLRKMAMKSKKIIIKGKGVGAPLSNPHCGARGNSPFKGKGRGLKDFLKSIPRPILDIIYKLHKDGMLAQILKLSAHV